MKKWNIVRKGVQNLHNGGEQVKLQTPRNAYYDSVSNVYHSLFLIFLAALLVFVCVAMLCNLELFTYENFYYLAKDINAASDMLAGSGNVINYETSVRNQTFTLYRKGLAVAGDSGLQLFTATGRETLNTSPDYIEPVLKGSGKYLLMYDIGEKRYSVYNSFVCVRHEEYDYPVFAGAMSDSGYYAVVTESYNHEGVVCLYNDRFELINRYNRTEKVTCVNVNEAGNRIAFATAGMKDGAFLTTLVIAVPGQSETSAEMKFEGLFPYSIEFIDQHRLLLIGDDAAYIVSVDDGTVICPIKYSDMQLSYADANQNYVAMVFSVNAVTDTYRMIVTDENGIMIMDQTFNAGISQVSLSEDYLFLLTAKGIVRITPADMQFTLTECHTDGKTLLICENDEVLLCGGQSAVYYNFED
ncbi:MAG: hypothetical protein IJW70_05785 [Clostridia bacterium]|nr:hypothetical protein [Clostridia bacterium]